MNGWRVIRAGVAASVLSTLAAQTASDPESKMTRRRREYPQLSAVVDLAGEAPAELRALGLLRVGSQNSIRDREWREELLEEAFETARFAVLAAPVTFVLPPNGPASQGSIAQMRRQSLYNAGADRLTLGSEAVAKLAMVNPQRAASLFDRLAKPATDTISCASQFVPNLEPYFAAAKAVAKTISPSDRARWLNTIVTRLNSSLEVAPALQLVQEAELSPAEQGTVAIALSATMELLPHNSRAWAADAGRVTERMVGLIDRSDPATAGILLRGWRSYLINGLSGSQCQEAVDPKREYSKWREDALKAFHDRAGAATHVASISEAEINPDKVEPGIPEEAPPSSAALNEINQSFQRLLFGGGRVGLTDAQKSSPEWKAEFSEHLGRIENLTNSDIPPGADVFWTKAQLLGGSIPLAPPGPERQQAADRYLQLLAAASIRPEDVPEWYFNAKNWISLCQAFGMPKKDVLAMLDRSGHPWLKLISSLEAPARER